MTAEQGSGRFPCNCEAPLGGLLSGPDQVEDRVKACDHVAGFQQSLSLLDRHRQQGRDRIGQKAGISDVGKAETGLKPQWQTGVIDFGNIR